MGPDKGKKKVPSRTDAQISFTNDSLNLASSMRMAKSNNYRIAQRGEDTANKIAQKRSSKDLNNMGPAGKDYIDASSYKKGGSVTKMKKGGSVGKSKKK